jgi:hypothetical protein
MNLKLIFLITYFSLLVILGIISFYSGIKSLSHLSEYGKEHRIKVASFWVGKKYYTTKGLIYRRRQVITSILMIALTFIFLVIVSNL